MEAKDSADITFLITVLALNGCGFFIVVVCYAQIWGSLGKETRQQEMSFAKRMALLVII
jgi:thyrotropin receptor